MDTSLQLYERIPDKYTKHKLGFNPDTYTSIQDMVNNDPEFEKEYFQQLIDKGWVKLKNTSDILYYPPGNTFKYRLNGNSISKVEEGTFRSGGFLVGKPLDSSDYILYKAYNGSIFPLQLADIQEIYVKDPKQEYIVFNFPTNITNYPVYLPHPITKEPTIVFYGRKSSDVTRFTTTKKFNKALKYGNWKFKD